MSPNRLLHFQNNWGFFPDVFYLIESPLAGGKNVHDNIDVVHENPARLSLTLDATRPIIVPGLQSLSNTVDNGLELPVTGAGANDEIINVRGKVLNIQQDDVYALLLFDGVDDGMSELENIQNVLR
jgi:hypothetical protein